MCQVNLYICTTIYGSNISSLAFYYEVTFQTARRRATSGDCLSRGIIHLERRQNFLKN